MSNIEDCVKFFTFIKSFYIILTRKIDKKRVEAEASTLHTSLILLRLNNKILNADSGIELCPFAQELFSVPSKYAASWAEGVRI